jgi:DNA-binding transcriptional LysR family regulator/tetratricopeptide (TPR) repeat protein
MDRRRLLFTIWNWLPAFQAVAEAEHLPTASARLSVTPSALSRTITMLEDRVGRQLFARKGRALLLNAHGRRLLAGITSAYSALSASLAALSSGELEGPVYACACGPLAQVLVVPALRELQQRSAKLVPYVYGYDAGEAIDLVRAGQLDVVFASARVEASDLTTTFLGETANGVFCGRKHPLFSKAAVRADDVLQHPFVVSCSPSDGKPNDFFLPGVERRVDLYVHQGHVVLDLCLSGNLLAVLPDFVAEPHVQEGALRRLPFPVLPSTPLFATSAGTEAQQERVRLVIEQVGRLLATTVTRPRQSGPRGSSSARAAEAADGSSREGDAGWLAMGDELLIHGEYAAAHRAYDSAYRARRKAGKAAKTDAARHALAIANVLTRRGRYGEAESTCERAVEGATPAIAAALEATKSLVRCFRGEFPSAKESLERARGHAVAATSRDGNGSDLDGARAWALIQRAEGNLLLETNRVREAIAAYEKCVATCETARDDWEQSIALFNLGDAYAIAGDVERATSLLDEAYRKKDEIGDRWGQAHVHLVRARIALAREDSNAALAEVTAGLQLATELADPKLTAALSNSLGRAQSRLGEHDEAQRAYRFALREAERCDARVDALRALLGLCWVQLERSKIAAAKGYAERAHALARECDNRPELAVALYALGEIAIAEDRPSDAASFYRSAFETQTMQVKEGAPR